MSDSAAIGPGHFAALVAEMAMLVCLWVAGLSWGSNRLASFALALLLVVVVVVVWGLWCAPRSTRRLARAPRWTLKIALVSATLALLISAGVSATWIVVGLATWLLMVGTLPWDTHELS